MVARTSRRLPGFSFEYQPPPPTNVLPRMDVAVFVGFAASGPLHIPVAVEDVTQFATIFGSDIPLAWDTQRSEQVYAYLAPAVRAFFRNGGQRCWVIRVAGDEAQYNYFPVPGLALVNDDGTLTPAFARARSQGSWSDDLCAGASLSSLPVIASQLSSSEESVTVNLALTSRGDISAGDLVRLTFSDGDYVLMLLVDSVQPIDAASISSPPDGPPNLSTVKVTACARTALWFKARSPRSPLPSPTQAIMFAHDAPLSPIAVSYYSESGENDPPTITLDLSTLFANAPEPGTMMRVDFDTDQLWLTVQQVHVEQDSSSPPGDIVVVTGQGLWLLQGLDVPNPWPTAISRAEKLSFTLWARQGNGFPQALSDLTFGEDHPSFWKALPTDEQLYRDAEATSKPTHSVLTKTLSYSSYTDLWQRALNPRFPLAGNDAPGTYYLPIAMPVSPDYYPGLDKGSSGQFAAPRTRDGLSEFSTNLFLDVDMIETLTTDLITQADYLRYSGPQPRPLKGIYAALSIEEASLIAIPDAYQLGWIPAFAGFPPQPQDSNPLPHPEWWHCQADMTAGDGQSAQQPPQGEFHNCDIQVIAPPVLELLDGPDELGTFRLGWTAQVTGTAVYILQEALRPDWVDAAVIYEGEDQSILLYGRGQGDYFYRVRVVIGQDPCDPTAPSSDWSAGIVVRVATTDLWQLKGEDEYDAHALIALQRALVRMCAARGDLFAVLALPEHYHEDDAIAHIGRLKSLLRPIELHTSSDPNSDDVLLIFPLGYGERSSFSYAALYYPWVIVSEDTNQLKNIPPDGTACGIMALRALARGAWIAPANERLSGVVDLTPPVSHANWQRLQDAQVNLIRQEPRGFLSLSSDTLSDEEDDDLRPINVRRLLILLRRLALRLGATYVFEPNSDAFRRRVQRGFETMLGQMFARGAFAGNTPGTSFQVVTDASINTPQSVDLGRFIVELRVAPSLPMTFLTIRLVQSATDGSVSEVR
jgi:hypothetical protein